MGGAGGALCSGARMHGFSSSYRAIVHRPMGSGDCEPTANWRVAACLMKCGQDAEELKGRGGQARCFEGRYGCVQTDPRERFTVPIGLEAVRCIGPKAERFG